MAFKPKLVETGPDAALLAALRGVLAEAEAGRVTDVMVVYGTLDARDSVARLPTDGLGLSAFAEEVAGRIKRRLLGLQDAAES